MIKCAVIDDEPLAISLLVNYIEKLPQLQLEKTFTDPIEALQYLQPNPCDLVFLDVQMPELNGIQLMKILGNKTKIILTTAYPNYALEGFENDAMDYLLKPISFDRFSNSIEKLKSRQLHSISAPFSTDFIFVKTEHRLQKLMLNELLYFEGLRDYVAIHIKGKKILTLQSLRSFEEILPTSQFIRIHKSYIISLNKINYIERNRVYIDTIPIPISSSYKDLFMARISS